MSSCKIFDTHAHYDSPDFDVDRYDLIESMLSSDVGGIINCATDYKTSRFSIELAHKYKNVYAAVGIHPEEVTAFDIDINLLTDMLKDEKTVAVGEIGLDYHYPDAASREMQISVFESQILLAQKLSKPVIVHERDSHQDVMDLLLKYKPSGVVHCFSSSPEEMRRLLKIGMYIGLGGTVTFKNARVPVEVAKEVPLDRLLLETDCPYMTPVPFRGKRNDSSKIIFVAEKIAEIKGISSEEVLTQTFQNAQTLFKIK